MGHIERRQKEKEELKQLILDAAKNIAIKEGWTSVTIRKIADAIDYTPPIVYEYFESKEDLIREIVTKGFYTLTKDFIQAGKTENDPKILLHKLSLIHWDFAFNNVELYQLMFSLERPVHDEDMHERVKFIKSAFLKLIKDEESLQEVMFSWMCLMQGAISFALKFPDLLKSNGEMSIEFNKKIGKSPKELYSSVLKRFIDRI